MLTLAAIAGGLFIAWKLTSGVKAAAKAVDPTNNDNIVNHGVNAAVGLDNKTASIGTKIYDWLHPDQATFPSAYK